MIWFLIYASFLLLIFVLSLRRFTSFTLTLFEKLTLPFMKIDIVDMGLKNLKSYDESQKRASMTLLKKFDVPKQNVSSQRIINVGERTTEEIMSGKADFGTRRNY